MARSSVGGLVLIFADWGVILQQTPSFNAECFSLLGRVLRCRRRRCGSREDGFELSVKDAIVRD